MKNCDFGIAFSLVSKGTGRCMSLPHWDKTEYVTLEKRDGKEFLYKKGAVWLPNSNELLSHDWIVSEIGGRPCNS
jgi:hypothetical protein